MKRCTKHRGYDPGVRSFIANSNSAPDCTSAEGLFQNKPKLSEEVVRTACHTSMGIECPSSALQQRCHFLVTLFPFPPHTGINYSSYPIIKRLCRHEGCSDVSLNRKLSLSKRFVATRRAQLMAFLLQVMTLLT
jgi:hypothetical protein